MSLPNAIFLKDRQGQSLGPIPLQALEVLYDARIVDDGTPVSADGANFVLLSETGPLLARVQQVKEMVVNGQDPWAQAAPVAAPPPIAASEPPPPSSPPVPPPPPGASVVRVMFDCARAKVTGRLVVAHPDGDITLSYSDGKVLAVDTTVAALGIGQFLIDRGVCDALAVRTGTDRAPMMGGDLGSALISLGLVQPHIYVEKFAEWARSVIGAAAAAPGASELFEEPVTAAAVPLGFDRFKVLIEALRAGFSKGELDNRLGEKMKRLIIPAGVDGVNIDQLKLDSRELRVFKLIDGTKNVEELLTSVQARGDSGPRVVYMMTELGFVVFGDDPLLPKERSQARELQDVLQRMEKQNYYEVLGVGGTADDEAVRGKYMELAKLYHPDKVRVNAAPELRDVRAKLFARILQAFETLEEEAGRKEYDGMLSAGVTTKEGEQALVAAILEAEDLFKKGEALVRMRKYDEAVAALKEAIELKPEDPEFEIHLTYYEFLTRKANREFAAEDAIRRITQQLKKQPNLASAHLFLGRLFKVANKADQAVKAFQKVLQFDERNTEAQSELRLANMRKEKKRKFF